MASQAISQVRQVLATNIRAARTSADLTQAQLAARIGIEPMLISKWERGLHAPSERNLVALAETLDRDISWFYVRRKKRST